jgi:thiol:disulfide interchange protein
MFGMAAGLLTGPVWGQFLDQSDDFSPPELKAEALRYITFRPVPSHTTVAPGRTFHVALDVKLADGWVWYGPVLGEKAMEREIPPALVRIFGEGFKTGPPLWRMTRAKPSDFGFPIEAYTKRTIVYFSMEVSPDAPNGPMKIEFAPFGQICGTSCMNIQPSHDGSPQVTVPLEVVVGPEEVANPDWSGRVAAGLDDAMSLEDLRDAIAARDAGKPDAEKRFAGPAALGADQFLAALGLALLAGLTLNIMPCVLPVIPIRILSIVEMAGQSRRRYVTMGLAFAAGMMLFFVALAAINVGYKTALGRAFDINEQFQQPWFMYAMAGIFVALAANLFGVFHVIVPSKVMGLDGDVQASRAGRLKSVGMGVMMAVLAVPCSFAYLVAALTFAAAAPLVEGSLVILAVGLGMSAPHILLAAFPKLVDKLPKPGRWMELFKQSAGFVLLLVAVYLVATQRVDGPSRPFWVLGWFVFLVAGLWMWAAWVRYDAPWRKKLLVRGLAAALVIGTGLAMLPAPEPALLHAETFDQTAIENAQKSGRIVVVKFWATWCPACYEQESLVFNTPEIAGEFERRDVAYFKGNLTRADLPAARWLEANGYSPSRAPLTLVYPPGEGEPVGAVELDKQRLIKLLDQAEGGK